MQIIFNDENYAILNKPAGMIVNNADTSRKVVTVQDWVEENFKLQEKGDGSGGESEFLKRGGIVHRLDKETSGALIVALNEESFVFLQNQFKERTVKKEYIALCHGKMIDESEISAPIGRLPWNRMRFGVIPQGRAAHTKFKTITHYHLKEGKSFEELSLLRVFPVTGRTHQIRVHLQYAGHPIFADPLYGGRKTYNHDKKYLARHFLHAEKISFISPTSEKNVTYEAPLSPELSALLKLLEIKR